MNDIEGRKADHIDLVMREDVRHSRNHWDDVRLVHNALPEIDLDDIDTRVTFLGSRMEHPLVVTAITGGYPRAEEINRNLAKACERLGIGMGVGSQRAALERGEDGSYTVLKEYEIPLRIANIGAPQLIEQGGRMPLGPEDVERAMEMIDGHCLAVHLNFLQETVQPEGDTTATGCLEAIRDLARDFRVMAKETGAGLSAEVADRLREAGVMTLDISGTGGTSFSAVEKFRAESVGNPVAARLGTTFREWGIPAPVSVMWAKVGLPMMASGGVRTGLDVARGVVLGATCGGLAGPVLKAAMESAECVVEELEIVMAELRAAMFLTGCEDLEQLGEADYLITGSTRDWLMDDNEVY
jgi:isopentenyl-diphosphate delta-isomerase